ncbi:MAG TPA: hypothetical protein VI588_02615 [Candidatus Gracilibacteria bacterium]|nr:hypothetical protein [Candidatus Gracilibacteria bacterium]
MADFESFSGFDAGGEAFDPASFERFKERMKAAAAQLKALQKQEQRQKQNEDELVKILLKFIQGDPATGAGKNKDREILLLVSRLLEQNVPAGFIVSLLLIAYKKIQEEMGVKLLPPGAENMEAAEGSEAAENRNLPDTYMGGKVLPLKVKIAITIWINEIHRRISDDPHRILKTAVDGDGLVILPAIQLGTFCLRNYLEQQKVEHEYEQLKEFVDFALNDAVQKAHDELKDRKELEE